MNNTLKWALVIGDKVYAAWKPDKLHDTIGGHQAYIHRTIYLFKGHRILQMAKTTHATLKSLHSEMFLKRI